MKASRDIITLTLGFVVVLGDQFTKTMIRQDLLLGETWPMIPGFFSLTYLRNTGAVWGVFPHQNMWLILLSLLVIGVIVIFYRRLVDDRWVYRVAIGCMIGGVLGNLVDRIKLGWVTDFLDFYLLASHWPSFNLADSSICVGVAIYLVGSLSSSGDALPEASSPG